MMSTIRQAEGAPETWPAIEGITGAALALAWQRIEHWIAWRFAPRTVVWRVLSDGCEWHPPLVPVVDISAETEDVEAHEPEEGPEGGYILPCGTVKVTATVGAGPVPEAVEEAIRRYSAYLTTAGQIPFGVTRFNSGAFSAAVSTEATAPGAAIVNSGAADLLRAYRGR